MILKKLTIEDFRAIRGRLEIEFDPDINLYVLVGKNSSGKSSILEAIGRSCWNPPANIRAEFYNEKPPKYYKLRSTKGIKDHLSQTRPGVFEADFEALLRAYNEDSLRNLSRVVSEVAMKDILFRRSGYDIRVSIEGQDIKPDELSSGIQALITIEAILNYPRIPARDHVIFLLEEPEAFLHPNLLRVYAEKLVNFAKHRKNAQLFISTHSPIFLSFVEPYQVIRVEQGRVYFNRDKNFDGWHLISDPTKAEIFFADRVLMLEGYTDKLVFSAILQNQNIRPETRNVCLVHIDGVYNREVMTRICEAFEIRNLFVGDRDQEKHKRRGGNRPDLSFEVLLPYGELEDAIPLIDWAMALEENLIRFLLSLLSEEENQETASEKLGKAMGKNKVRYALMLRNHYLQNPLGEDHPLYPLSRIMKDFIETGLVGQESFPEKADIREELEDYTLVFVQQNLQGNLEKTDLCIEEEKVVGVFFDSKLIRKLNSLLVELVKKSVPFYLVADSSYNLEGLRKLITKDVEDIEVEKHQSWLKIKKGNLKSLAYLSERPLDREKDINRILNLQPLSKE